MTVLVEAPAKVNLSLRVSDRDASGLHPLRSLVQMISWYDILELAFADEDTLALDPPSAGIPDGGDNLVWRAVAWHRRLIPCRERLGIVLRKRISIAAGLGGGSSDAAATVVGLDELTHRSSRSGDLAELGADVPFARLGGSAWMEGYGDILSVREVVSDYALVIAVPPLELATVDVYARWDRLDGPQGPAMTGRALPPSLRGEAPLINDLYPAAISLAAELADYRSDLSAAWQRPVAMSGSGPSLFAFFADADEAAAAANELDGPYRAVEAVVPIDHGARIVEIRDR